MCYFDLLRIYATAFDINPDGDGVIIKNMFGYETNARSSKKVCIDMINSLLTEATSVRNQPAKNGWLSQTAANTCWQKLHSIWETTKKQPNMQMM